MRIFSEGGFFSKLFGFTPKVELSSTEKKTTAVSQAGLSSSQAPSSHATKSISAVEIAEAAGTAANALKKIENSIKSTILCSPIDLEKSVIKALTKPGQSEQEDRKTRLIAREVFVQAHDFNKMPSSGTYMYHPAGEKNVAILFNKKTDTKVEVTVLKELAAGGMGVVYSAQQITASKVEVAKTVIKVPKEGTSCDDEAKVLEAIRKKYPNGTPGLVRSYESLTNIAYVSSSGETSSSKMTVLKNEQLEGGDLNASMKDIRDNETAKNTFMKNFNKNFYEAASGINTLIKDFGFIPLDIKMDNFVFEKKNFEGLKFIDVDSPLIVSKDSELQSNRIARTACYTRGSEFVIVSSLKYASNEKLRKDEIKNLKIMLAQNKINLDIKVDQDGRCSQETIEKINTIVAVYGEKLAVQQFGSLLYHSLGGKIIEKHGYLTGNTLNSIRQDIEQKFSNDPRKDLMLGALQLNPNERLTMDEVQQQLKDLMGEK